MSLSVLLHVRFVKNISTFLVFVSYVFFATSAKEFIKLPKLVEHYYDHRSDNQDKGLMAFLFRHYYQEDGTDRDAKEDSELPFKSIPENPVTISVHKPSFSTVIIGKPAPKESEFYATGNTEILTRYLNAVWHPPRDC